MNQKINKLFASLALLALFAPAVMRAQDVKEAPVKVGKDHKSGFVAASAYGKAEVASIMASKMEAAGLKKRSKKSKFYLYKGVTWQVTGPNKVDLYYKVTGKKHKARVLFVASKGYDNYITTTSDAATAASISAWLGQLDAAIAVNQSINQKEMELKALNESLQQYQEKMKKTEEAKKKKIDEVKTLQKTEAY